MPMSTLTCTSVSAVVVLIIAEVWVRRLGTSLEVVPLLAEAGTVTAINARMTAASSARLPPRATCPPIGCCAGQRRTAAGVTGPGGAISAPREPGLPPLHLGTIGGLAAELAQHADGPHRDAVDEQVRRRQVELAPELGGR
jgi:hypothetical protein